MNEPQTLGLRGAVNAYLSHFNPTYLFTAGDLEWRHHNSDHGQLLLWDLPLLCVGAVVLVRHWRRPAMQALGSWLLIGPVAATFAENAPHAVRTIVMVPSRRGPRTMPFQSSLPYCALSVSASKAIASPDRVAV